MEEHRIPDLPALMIRRTSSVALSVIVRAEVQKRDALGTTNAQACGVDEYFRVKLKFVELEVKVIYILTLSARSNLPRR